MSKRSSCPEPRVTVFGFLRMFLAVTPKEVVLWENAAVASEAHVWGQLPVAPRAEWAGERRRGAAGEAGARGPSRALGRAQRWEETPEAGPPAVLCLFPGSPPPPPSASAPQGFLYWPCLRAGVRRVSPAAPRLQQGPSVLGTPGQLCRMWALGVQTGASRADTRSGSASSPAGQGV